MSEEDSRRQQLVRFLTTNLLKGVVGFAAVIFVLYLLSDFVKANYDDWVLPVADKPFWVMTFFFLNEFILGFVPPELFMGIYSGKPEIVYWQYITLMTALSYLGGIVSYYFGKLFQRAPFMKRFMERQAMVTLKGYYERFGGVIILIAAVTPIPFALTSLLSGVINYPFGSYLKWGFFRFLRFFPYAYAVYHTIGIPQLS